MASWERILSAYAINCAAILDLFAPSSSYLNTSIDVALSFTHLLFVESESHVELSIESVEGSDVRASGRTVSTLY